MLLVGRCEVKSISKWLTYSGWGLFLISAVQPVYYHWGGGPFGGLRIYNGWQATLECLKPSPHFNPILMLNALTSLVMLAAGLTIIERFAYHKNYLPYVLLGCGALNTYPVFFVKQLHIGYWTWFLSFALVAAGMTFDPDQPNARINKNNGIGSTPQRDLW